MKHLRDTNVAPHREVLPREKPMMQTIPIPTQNRAKRPRQKTSVHFPFHLCEEKREVVG